VKEGTIDELRGRRSLIVRANPEGRATSVLEALPEVKGVVAHDDVLSVTADPASAVTINRALVEAGVAVSELRSDRASLEEVFLGLTRDDE